MIKSRIFHMAIFTKINGTTRCGFVVCKYAIFNDAWTIKVCCTTITNGRLVLCKVGSFYSSCIFKENCAGSISSIADEITVNYSAWRVKINGRTIIGWMGIFKSHVFNYHTVTIYFKDANIPGTDHVNDSSFSINCSGISNFYSCAWIEFIWWVWQIYISSRGDFIFKLRKSAFIIWNTNVLFIIQFQSLSFIALGSICRPQKQKQYEKYWYCKNLFHFYPHLKKLYKFILLTNFLKQLLIF